MRIRPVWIAVPACAAAGVVTYSVVAAQESAPPAGYYAPRTTPHPSVQADNEQYIRPSHMTSPPPARNPDLPPPSLSWSAVPPKLAAAQAPADKPKVIQTGGNDPPRPKLIPAGGVPAADAGPLAPPILSVPVIDVPLAAAPPAVAPPGMAPPVVMLEPAPAPGPRVELLRSEEPKPLPVITLAAPPAVPLPVIASPFVTAPAVTPPMISAPFPTATPIPAPVISPLPAVTPSPIVTALTPAAPAPLPVIGMTVPVRPAPMARSAELPTAALPARQAPMVVVETVAPESIGVGQNLTYELVVKNTGSAAVTNVKVDDELPAGAAFVSSDPAAKPDGMRLTWAVGTLDGGAEKRIRIVVKPGEERELRSLATVTFSTTTETRVNVTRPRVGVAVSGVETARVGDEVAFTIKVTNTGTGPAQKLLLQAKLSEGLYHPQGGVIEAELLGLMPGETRPITLKAIASRAGTHSCNIVASADGNPAETAKLMVAVVEPLLQAKLTGPAKCLVRSEPTFTLELANPGTAATDPVQAWAVVPEGFDFVTASDGGSFTTANRTIVWKLAGVPHGATKQLTMKLRANTPFEGVVRTVVQAVPATDAAAGGGVQRAGGSARVLEAKAETPVRADGVSALRFEVQDLEDPVEVGKEALYEIKVMNQGTGPCTNVVVSATLSEGTSVAGVTGPTTGRGQGLQVSFDPVATLNTKGEAVFQVRVKGGAAGDTRFKVRVSCDQTRTPIEKEENTRFYKE